MAIARRVRFSIIRPARAAGRLPTTIDAGATTRGAFRSCAPCIPQAKAINGAVGKGNVTSFARETKRHRLSSFSCQIRELVILGKVGNARSLPIKSEAWPHSGLVRSVGGPL